MLNILAVDDNQGAQILIKNAIKRAGFNCTTYGNAQEALNSYKDGNFDVVITDIKMPDMDGVEFISRLHSLDREVKIIILTILEDFEIVGERIKDNIVASYEKQSDFSNLIKKLKEIDS